MSPALKIPLALNRPAMDATFDPLGFSQDRYHAIWDSLLKRGIVKKQRKVLTAQLAHANVSRKWLGYTAKVQTKNEAGQEQDWNLMVDTGSGLTWVHGDRQQFHVQAPSASHPASAWNGKDFQSVYARGSASGNLRDVFEVLIGHESAITTIHKQVIGVAASHSIGDIGADGLLGLGPKALTAQLGTYAHPIPTVIDTFNAKEKEANANAKEIFGIYFEPWSVPGGKGHLSFGDVDKSSIKGDITWVDFLQTPELRDYYGFEMSVHYKHKGSTGNIELLKNDEGNEKVHGLTDTGSTLILLDPAMFETYHQAIGAEWDFRTKLWRLTIENYEKLGDLIFKIGGRDFKFAPEAQVFPLAWNVAQRGSSSGVATHRWLTIGPVDESISEFSFQLGSPFMQRFYTCYDHKLRKHGFAETAHT